MQRAPERNACPAAAIRHHLQPQRRRMRCQSVPREIRAALATFQTVSIADILDYLPSPTAVLFLTVIPNRIFIDISEDAITDDVRTDDSGTNAYILSSVSGGRRDIEVLTGVLLSSVRRVRMRLHNPYSHYKGFGLASSNHSLERIHLTCVPHYPRLAVAKESAGTATARRVAT
ncbi:hypothetical protein PsYK624_131330 [Phanerochaete sordida]|uniref:Uncharacterized protein n=1 Tax=Phanerochaete sordida TaxID=48140 RepID=A0A9P3LJ17_9APHY|nr:hypothetical protein PsYK624_131330 [Phanerochaete sordida]